MADITVTYNGSTILTTSADGTKTLKTAGKYCLDNIAVQFSPPPDNKINEIINRTISTYTNDHITTIGDGAFAWCKSLTAVSFPACTTIRSHAFEYCMSLTIASFPACTSMDYYAFWICRSLTTARFPKCTYIGDYAFSGCTSLTTVSFPACTYIGRTAFDFCPLTTVSFPACTSIANSAFGRCSSLTTASFPKCTYIGSYAFRGCIRLKSLYLTNSSVATLYNSNTFSSTPIGGYSTTAGTYGSIYVPASLLASYKVKTNWTYFSSRFVGV